jgi:ribosomal protein S18 acetylase RimI-like enzyme
MIRRLCINDLKGLLDLFREFRSANYERFFHPHEFNRNSAEAICRSSGGDYYCCEWDEGTAVSYGMLRGFDAGYLSPSLGIAVRPNYVNSGRGRVMVGHLHQVARQMRVRKIRLKVYPENLPAISLYQTLGYEFQSRIENGQMVGWLTLLP